MKRLKFKKLLLACVGFTALAGASALAADVPPPRSMPPLRAPAYVPFFSWNGFYLGINGGYGFSQSNWSGGGVSTGNFIVNGGLVGGTMGYNLQFGSAVFGIEGDIDWSNMTGSTTVNCPLTCQTRNTWLGTARGRIGYAFDRFLPYFTGGGAFGEIKGNVLGVNVVTKTQFGWTVGAGMEYAFTPNWTMKAEYLYVDLGTVACAAANCGIPTNITFKANVVRGGLNYKF